MTAYSPEVERLMKRLFASLKERSSPLRSHQGGQARAWRDRIDRRHPGIRSQDDPSGAGRIGRRGRPEYRPLSKKGGDANR